MMHWSCSSYPIYRQKCICLVKTDAIIKNIQFFNSKFMEIEIFGQWFVKKTTKIENENENEKKRTNWFALPLISFVNSNSYFSFFLLFIIVSFSLFSLFYLRFLFWRTWRTHKTKKRSKRRRVKFKEVHCRKSITIIIREEVLLSYQNIIKTII